MSTRRGSVTGRTRSSRRVQRASAPDSVSITSAKSASGGAGHTDGHDGGPPSHATTTGSSAASIVFVFEVGARTTRVLGPADVDAEQLQDREQRVVGARVDRAVLAPRQRTSIPFDRARACSCRPLDGSVSRSRGALDPLRLQRRLRPAIGIPTQSGRWSSS